MKAGAEVNVFPLQIFSSCLLYLSSLPTPQKAFWSVPNTVCICLYFGSRRFCVFGKFSYLPAVPWNYLVPSSFVIWVLLHAITRLCLPLW